MKLKKSSTLNLILEVNSDVLYLHGSVFHLRTLAINPYFPNVGNREMESYCVNKAPIFKDCFYFSDSSNFSFLMIPYSFCFLINATRCLDYEMLSLIEIKTLIQIS